MKPAWRRPAVLLLLLLAAGCADLPGLLSLRAALNREFPNTAIGVRLTDESLLTVTLANSPLQFAPCERRVAEALRLATFIRDHYNGFTALRLVSIEFTSRDASDSGVRRASHFPIRFEPSAIVAGLTGLDSTRAAETCRTLDQLD